MTTLQKQLQSSTLSPQCKADLLSHVLEVEVASQELPHIPVTSIQSDLPTGSLMSTVNTRMHETLVPHDGPAEERRTRFAAQKREKETLMATLSHSQGATDGPYFKECSHRFLNDDRTKRDPFQATRSRAELSGKDKDFVHRYAVAVTKTSVPRPAPADEAGVAATEAYKAAFAKYKGRPPTAKELEEVGRLAFAFDENGSVGVLQKPHSCYPHTHISSCKTHTQRCSNQVYAPEVPAVRAARSEFPGPIPTWTSTKNSVAVATNGTYQTNHQVPASLKRAAMDSVVGSH